MRKSAICSYCHNFLVDLIRHVYKRKYKKSISIVRRKHFVPLNIIDDCNECEDSSNSKADKDYDKRQHNNNNNQVTTHVYQSSAKNDNVAINKPTPAIRI